MCFAPPNAPVLHELIDRIKRNWIDDDNKRNDLYLERLRLDS